MAKRIVCDLDGTLCSQEKYGEYHLAKPLQDNIDKINYAVEQGWHVTIFTARGMNTFNGDVKAIKTILRAPTIFWLKEHGVRYHVLKFGKPPADFYIDDKGWSPHEISKRFFDL